MLFIDLNKLKIIKDYNYETRAGEIVVNIDEPLMAQSEPLVRYFQNFIQPCGISVLYDITIAANETPATEDEAEDFVSVTNFLVGIFFANMIKEDGRKREHRLKKAINQQTINNVFNLTIRYKDLVYILCDEKEIKDA